MQFLQQLQNDFYTCFIAKARYMDVVNGLINTLVITIFALLLGVVIGLILALFKSLAENNRKLRVLGTIANVYLSVIRGTPVVLQLMIWFYLVLAGIKNPIPVAIIGFGVNSGAYVCEIFRSGIQSISKGQMEAGRSIGLTYWQTMRLIILPQAFKNALPTLGNEFITLVKETSVVGYISGHDLTRAAYNIRNATYNSFMPLIGTAIIYFLLVMLISKILSGVERRMRLSDNR